MESVLRYTEDVDVVFTKNNPSTFERGQLIRKRVAIGLLVEYLFCGQAMHDTLRGYHTSGLDRSESNAI